MVFSSFVFLLYFFPAFILLYLLSPTKVKNYTLLLASLFFYAWGAPGFIGILIFTTLVDFFIVRQIYQAKSLVHKKLYLALSLSLSIGVFLYYKYANFFIENVNVVLSLAGAEKVNWTKIALPIGISFFSFQKITYALDVYRNTHKPRKSAFDYVLYILMFPQLIAGPIVRFNAIADQITSRKATSDDFSTGLPDL